MTATTYRLEQWTETYDAAGEGLMSRMGPEDEVYAMVKITKVGLPVFCCPLRKRRGLLMRWLG